MPKYDIKRGAAIIASVIAEGNQNVEAMGVNEVNMKFTLINPVVFQVGDWCQVYGNKYIVYRKPEYTKVNERQHEYDLYLVHEFYKLQDSLLMGVDKNAQLNEKQFYLTGNLQAFADLVLLNANRNSSGWTLGTVDSTGAKTMQFDGENILASLNRIAAEFETEFWINGKTISFTKQLVNSGITLGYGENKGLISLKKGNKDSNATIFTRLFVEGAERNLPSYTNYGYKRLQLPSANNGKVDNTSAIAAFGVIEHYAKFDDIFPKHTGTITSVGDEFTFYDSALPFNINDQLLPGVTAYVAFQSGVLAGYNFDIASFDDATKKFVINENEDEKTVTLPNATLKPAIGDTYIIFDIQMPSSHITAAENDLLAAANALLAQGSDIDFNDTFTGNCDPLYFKRNTIAPVLGQYVQILETNPAINVTKRMSAISRDLQNQWKYDITFTDKIEVNKIVREYIKTIEETNVINETINRVAINREAARRAAQRIDVLRGDVFDPDGYFDGTHLKPETIEAIMATFGYKSGSLTLEGVAFSLNVGGVANNFNITAGKLIHFAYDIGGAYTWVMGSMTSSFADSAQGYYIYAKISKITLTGSWVVNNSKLQVDNEVGYYTLLIGRVYPVTNGKREVDLLYGVTNIVGNRIQTGIIQDLAGTNFWNLDTGEMRVSGQITVGAGSNVYTKTETDAVAGNKNFTAAPLEYKVGDTWTLQTDLLLNGIQYKAGDVLTTLTSSTSFVSAHWDKRVRYVGSDDIKIGDNNLLRNSAGPFTPWNEYLAIDIYKIVQNRAGKDISIAFDLKTPVAGSVSVYSLGGFSFDSTKHFNATTDFQRFSLTTKFTNNGGGSSCDLSFYGGYGSGVIPTVRDIRIVEGNRIPETWVPAIEDVAYTQNRDNQLRKTDLTNDAQESNYLIYARSAHLTDVFSKWAITISFDIMFTNVVNGECCVYHAEESKYSFMVWIAGITTSWQRKSITVTPSMTGAAISTSSLGFYNSEAAQVIKVRNVMINFGAEALPYKMAPQDIIDEFEAFDTYVDGAFRDGVIEAAEAAAIEKYINVVNDTYEQLVSSYNVVYNDALLTGTPKTNLATAKTNLDTSKTALLAAINTAITDGETTPAEKAAVDAAYSDFKTKNGLYTTAIENAYKSITDAINTKANSKLTMFTSGAPSAGTYKIGDLWKPPTTQIIDGVTFTGGKVYVCVSIAGVFGQNWKTDAAASYGATLPTTTTAKVGDLFIHEGDNNKMYVYNGTAWVEKADVRIPTAINDAANALAANEFVDGRRTNNDNPTWYLTNYPRKTRKEFKELNAIGIYGYGTYGGLTTTIPYDNSSAGWVLITQEVTVSQRTFTRTAVDATNWSSWIDLKAETDAANALVPTFMGSAFPSNPKTGSKWFDTATMLWKEWNGSSWVTMLDSDKMTAKYLRDALSKNTDLIGGLILTSVVGVRNSASQVTAYINGNGNTYGEGIAIATGVTDFGLATETQKGVDRHNGSGFRAGNKLWWDKDGNAKVGGFFLLNDKLSSALTGERTEIVSNGIIRGFNSGGNKGYELKSVNGRYALTFYAPDGSVAYKIGQDGSDIPASAESFTPVGMYKFTGLPTTYAALTTAQKSTASSLIKTNSSRSSNIITVSLTMATKYLYDAGNNASTPTNAPYNGYKDSNSDRTDHVSDGWYGLDFPPQFGVIGVYDLVFIQDGKIVSGSNTGVQISYAASLAFLNAGVYTQAAGAKDRHYPTLTLSEAVNDSIEVFYTISEDSTYGTVDGSIVLESGTTATTTAESLGANFLETSPTIEARITITSISITETTAVSDNTDRTITY